MVNSQTFSLFQLVWNPKFHTRLQKPETVLRYDLVLRCSLNKYKSLFFLLHVSSFVESSGPRYKGLRLLTPNSLCNTQLFDRLCGLVVRVSGYRYRGLGFDSRRYQIF